MCFLLLRLSSGPSSLFKWPISPALSFRTQRRSNDRSCSLLLMTFGRWVGQHPASPFHHNRPRQTRHWRRKSLQTRPCTGPLALLRFHAPQQEHLVACFRGGISRYLGAHFLRVARKREHTFCTDERFVAQAVHCNLPQPVTTLESLKMERSVRSLKQ